MSAVSVEAVPDADVPGARGNNTTTDANGHFTFTLAAGRYEFDALAPLTGPKASYYEQDFGAPPGYSNTGDLVKVSANGPMVFNWALYRNNVPYVGPLINRLRWTHPAGQSFSTMKLLIGDGSYAAMPITWPADTLVLSVTDKWGDVLDKATTDIAPGASPQEYGSSGEDTTGCGYAIGSLRPGRHVGHPVVRDLTEVTATAYLQSQPTVSATQTVRVDRSECFKTKLTGGFLARMVTLKQAPAIIDVHDRAPSGKGLSGWLMVTIGRKTRRIHVAASLSTTDGVSWVDLDLARLNLLHTGPNTAKVAFAPSDPSYSEPHPLTIRVRVRK